jgi:acyl-CoA dehydrogenase
VTDFAVDEAVAELAERVRAFVRETVIPREREDDAAGGHGLDDGLRRELQDAARAAGLLTPQAPLEEGGHGLDHRGQAVIFEEAGYSLLGPQALNCAAPDEGNMHLLRLVATPAQHDRYLAPLVAGQTRSCFAMTEPAPGAGSDPSMLRTTARRDGDDWVLDGDKWFITGAVGAAFAIVMARTGERIERDEGATMFLVDADTPGFEVRRAVGSIDRSFPGGHAEVTFAGCRVPGDAVLGEEGLGYRYAQVRLAPARLTHCERWLGLARRSLDIALDRAREREAFGQRLEELGMVQALIADSVLDLDASRLMIQRCAWELDQGRPARGSSSAAKVFVAEAVGRVVDRAVQICGSLGVSEELPLGRYLAEVRAFRIYDGPSETHRWALARRAARDRARAVGEG